MNRGRGRQLTGTTKLPWTSCERMRYTWQPNVQVRAPLRDDLIVHRVQLRRNVASYQSGDHACEILLLNEQILERAALPVHVAA